MDAKQRGEAIKQRRLDLGMSARAFVRGSGVSRESLERVERGSGTDLALAKAEKFLIAAEAMQAEEAAESGDFKTVTVRDAGVEVTIKAKELTPELQEFMASMVRQFKAMQDDD